MKQALLLKVKQQQGISPKLQQAIKLLHLSAPELELEIQALIESNPILELADDYEESSDYSQQFSQYEHIVSEQSPSLQEYLLWQLNLAPFSTRDRNIAITIIDSINDDGYLETSLDEIQNVLQQQAHDMIPPFENDEILMVLHRVQQFDPPGVGARTLQECMELQLRSQEIEIEINALCQELISYHLELLAVRDYAKIRKALNITDETLNICIQKITSLHPKPGILFNAHQTEYIAPDVLVQNIDNVWIVNLSQHVTNNLRINQSYAQLLKNSTSSYDNQGLRQQYNEAKWLLASIKQRNITLLKVANWIMQQQQAFLEFGEAHLKPLNLTDVASALNLSTSTISRITTRKYIHTPRGMYELKYFFSGGINSMNGDLHAATGIKAMIREIISLEDPNKPLSDQALTDIIATRGIRIARRTVAKYREAIGIQPSNQRGI